MLGAARDNVQGSLAEHRPQSQPRIQQHQDIDEGDTPANGGRDSALLGAARGNVQGSLTEHRPQSQPGIQRHQDVDEGDTPANGGRDSASLGAARDNVQGSLAEHRPQRAEGYRGLGINDVKGSVCFVMKFAPTLTHLW